MSAVITKVSFATFHRILSDARDAHPLIALNTISGDELLSKVCRAVDSMPWPTNMLGKAGDKTAHFFRHRCKVRVAFRDNEPVAGYVVLDGELLCVHSTVKGLGKWLVQNAVADGAAKLDCFDVPALRGLYEWAGFKVTSRAPNYVRGEPDVIYMSR